MKIKLNAKQMHRKTVIEKTLKGLCTNREAAMALNLCKGYVKTLKRKYRQKGDIVFIHGNTGRKPANTMTQDEIERILIIKESINSQRKKIYDKITFAHFTRKLEENYGIKRSRNTICKLLKEHGYRSLKKHKTKKRSKIHESRPRKEKMGQLLQGDGTPFDWFENGKSYCLHALIDDATKIPTGMFMTKNECSFGYYECFRQTAVNHGLPKALYVDGLSVFFSNREPTIEEQLAGIKPKTQFAEALDNLGVELIHAHSPQAKGRVERFWETVQQILPVELKERNITTVEEANDYLPEFIKRYSRWFSEKADGDVFRELNESDEKKLASILSVKVERTTNKGCVLSLKNYLFKAHKNLHADFYSVRDSSGRGAKRR